MGGMKKLATAKMFGQDAVNMVLYGSIYKPKAVKEPKTPKEKKPRKTKAQKELNPNVQDQ